jgi:hypothetical protein
VSEIDVPADVVERLPSRVPADSERIGIFNVRWAGRRILRLVTPAGLPLISAVIGVVLLGLGLASAVAAVAVIASGSFPAEAGRGAIVFLGAGSLGLALAACPTRVTFDFDAGRIEFERMLGLLKKAWTAYDLVCVAASFDAREPQGLTIALISRTAGKRDLGRSLVRSHDAVNALLFTCWLAQQFAVPMQVNGWPRLDESPLMEVLAKIANLAEGQQYG